MIAFQVNDMTCGHCVSVITKALKSADAQAKVSIDLGRHLVVVEPGEAGAHELGDAIAEAGYTPALVEGTTMAGPAVAPARPSCCGCR